jgi:PQQ-dependent catabolism-associated CXXCW motif protein
MLRFILASALLTSAAAADDFGGSFGGSTAPAQTAPAQTGSGDFGGNFGEGGSPAPAAPGNGQASAQSEGDSFGGSFGEAGTSPATGTPPPATGQPPASVGGDDFAGGSFGPGPAAGVNAEPPAVGGQVPPEYQGTQPGTAPAPQAGQQVAPQIFAFETRDFGIPPQSSLRAGQFHGATPTAIPGGKLVSTQGLFDAINGQMQVVLIDVLGASYGLPGAQVAPAMASPGSFQDRTQQQTAQWLAGITGNRTDTPIIVYCSDPQCWLSYNGALRAIAAGYTNVYWYRGGLQAWQMAGLPLKPTSF